MCNKLKKKIRKQDIIHSLNYSGFKLSVEGNMHFSFGFSGVSIKFEISSWLE